MKEKDEEHRTKRGSVSKKIKEEPASVEPPPINVEFIGDKQKPYEICRSEKMPIRCLRQMISSIHGSVLHFRSMSTDGKHNLFAMNDVANEYNEVIKILDKFYSEARAGIGEIQFYIVGEARGFTKKVKVTVEEEKEDAT